MIEEYEHHCPRCRNEVADCQERCEECGEHLAGNNTAVFLAAELMQRKRAEEDMRARREMAGRVR